MARDGDPVPAVRIVEPVNRHRFFPFGSSGPTEPRLLPIAAGISVGSANSLQVGKVTSGPRAGIRPPLGGGRRRDLRPDEEWARHVAVGSCSIAAALETILPAS